MRVLITNCILCTRSGTETYVRDLALGLQAAGHRPMVFSPVLGKIAWEISSAGIPVAREPRDLPCAPDIIHGHHHPDTALALRRFPETPAIFVCHAWRGILNTPPRLAAIRRFVAVDYHCRGLLLLQPWMRRECVRVIYNAVDTGRFLPRPPLPARPRRALIFSSYAEKDTHLEPVRESCRRLDLPVDVMGYRSGAGCDRPEEFLKDYDLVFAKARCALEALAVGCAVVLCDFAGLGEMVTAESVRWMRPFNFGQRLLHRPLDPSLIAGEIGRYDPDSARAASGLIREHAALDSCVDQFLRLYEEVLSEPRPRHGSWDFGFAAVGGGRAGLAARAAHRARLLLMWPYFNLLLPNSYFRDRVWPALIRWRERWMPGTPRHPAKRMDPLPESVHPDLQLVLVACPARVERNAEFKIEVRLANRTRQALAALPPYPLRFAYRWLGDRGEREETGGMPAGPVLPVLPPGAEACYTLVVRSPALEGSRTLRCTLMQEDLRWFDEGRDPVQAEIPVQVV